VKSFEATEVNVLKVNNSRRGCCKSYCRLSKAAVMEVDQWAEFQPAPLWWPNQSKPFLQLELCKDLGEASGMEPPRSSCSLHPPVSGKGLSSLVRGVPSLFANKNFCPN